MPISLSPEEAAQYGLRAPHDPRYPGVCWCTRPILGRQGNATTCLVHRGFPGPPNRSEMVALIKQHEGAAQQLREELARFDADEAGER